MQRALAEAGIKVKDIADELEVGESTVSRWLGDRGGVKPIYLRQWALRTGVDYEWLKTGEHGSPGSPGGGLPNSGWTRRQLGVSVLTPRINRTRSLVSVAA